MCRGVYRDSLDYDRNRRNIQSGVSFNPLRHSRGFASPIVTSHIFLEGGGRYIAGHSGANDCTSPIYLVLDEVVRLIPIAIKDVL